jgi:hypothetical protein
MAGNRWFRMDTTYGSNRKIYALTDKAFRCHVIAIGFCAEHLTDGMLTHNDMKQVMRVASVSDRRLKDVVQQLVRMSLLEPVEGGWMLHDFLTMNPGLTRANVELERKKNRERQYRYRTNVTP